MLIHRKNWCRVCGTCLTCPRTRRSLFQQGSCRCVERQTNHVSPQRVKGEMLFSFRYRHLSAEDIDILDELRPKFKFATLPFERNLVRANICSTCQQRLRRARLARRRENPDCNQLCGSKDTSDSTPESDSSSYGRQLLPGSRTQPKHISTPVIKGRLAGRKPHLEQSAMRSTLSLVAPAAERDPEFALSGVHDAADRHRTPGSFSTAGLPKAVPAVLAPDTNILDSASEGDLDETRIDLDINCNDDDSINMWSSAEKTQWPLASTLPPLRSPRSQSPRPTLPPPHILLIALRDRSVLANHACIERYGTFVGPAPQIQSYGGMLPNIEFRDASNTVLFQETISADYALGDIFIQHYPDAPRSLLFYAWGNVALPWSTTLGCLSNQHSALQLPVVVWARMPVAADPTHRPQW